MSLWSAFSPQHRRIHNHTQMLEGGEGEALGIYDWTLSRGDYENILHIYKYMHRNTWSIGFYGSQATLLKHRDLDLFLSFVNFTCLRPLINVPHLFKLLFKSIKLLALSYTSSTSKITIFIVRKASIWKHYYKWDSSFRSLLSSLLTYWMWEWESTTPRCQVNVYEVMNGI